MRRIRVVTGAIVMSARTRYAALRERSTTGRRPIGAGRSAHQISPRRTTSHPRDRTPVAHWFRRQRSRPRFPGGADSPLPIRAPGTLPPVAATRSAKLLGRARSASCDGASALAPPHERAHREGSGQSSRRNETSYALWYDRNPTEDQSQTSHASYSPPHDGSAGASSSLRARGGRRRSFDLRRGGNRLLVARDVDDAAVADAVDHGGSDGGVEGGTAEAPADAAVLGAERRAHVVRRVHHDAARERVVVDAG